VDGGRDGPSGSAAQFHPDESGNAKQEKDEKKNQESRVDREHGSGENPRER